MSSKASVAPAPGGKRRKGDSNSPPKSGYAPYQQQHYQQPTYGAPPPQQYGMQQQHYGGGGGGWNNQQGPPPQQGYGAGPPPQNWQQGQPPQQQPNMGIFRTGAKPPPHTPERTNWNNNGGGYRSQPPPTPPHPNRSAPHVATTPAPPTPSTGGSHYSPWQQTPQPTPGQPQPWGQSQQGPPTPQTQWTGGPPPAHVWQGNGTPGSHMPQPMSPANMWNAGQTTSSPLRQTPSSRPNSTMLCQPIGMDRNSRDEDDKDSKADLDKGRGSYRCGRCGVPKKGHQCPYQPKLKRRPDEPPPQVRNASCQVEMDEFMVLRRLNIEIQGFPESYCSEPYLTEDRVGAERFESPHPEMGKMATSVTSGTMTDA